MMMNDIAVGAARSRIAKIPLDLGQPCDSALLDQPFDSGIDVRFGMQFPRPFLLVIHFDQCRSIDGVRTKGKEIGMQGLGEFMAKIRSPIDKNGIYCIAVVAILHGLEQPLVSTNQDIRIDS